MTDTEHSTTGGAPDGFTAEERAAPTDLIRAILRAPVDLLWNGGIGTRVKASDETDADAAARASDAIRVDARQLRARVVGDGGNLGFTRRARVDAQVEQQRAQGPRPRRPADDAPQQRRDRDAERSFRRVRQHEVEALRHIITFCRGVASVGRIDDDGVDRADPSRRGKQGGLDPNADDQQRQLASGGEPNERGQPGAGERGASV